MKPFNFFALLSAFTLWASCSSAQKTGEHTQVIAPKDFQAAFAAETAAGTHPYLIDVRTPSEVAGGKIEGSENIVYGASGFAEALAKLDKTRPVFVYCAVGGRSGRTTPQLESLGFVKIFDLAGGYNAWKSVMGK